MINAIKIELIKQRRWIPVLCVFLPFMLNLLLLLSLSTRYEGYLLPHMQELKLTYWQLIFKEQTILYFSELCHIVVAALVFETFYIELKDNGWMLIASTQYRKKGVIQGKFVVVLINIMIYFISDYTFLYIIGKIIGVYGKFEAALFLKSFSVQVFSSAMMAAFFIMLVCLLRKISFLLPLSFGVMVLNIGLYYGETNKLLLKYPFTYISHGFRVTGKEMLAVILITFLLKLLFLNISKKTMRKNSDFVM